MEVVRHNHVLCVVSATTTLFEESHVQGYTPPNNGVTIDGRCQNELCYQLYMGSNGIG